MENDVVYKAMTFCNIAIDILENKKKKNALNWMVKGCWLSIKEFYYPDLKT